MNSITGEIKDYLDVTQEELDTKEWIKLEIGDVVQIYGTDCKLVNVNKGKRRLTFTPVSKLGRLP